MKTINQNLIKAKYEVRGGIVLRAEEIRKEMEKGKSMPFKEFVFWNIGNPQNLGQLPISFTREVLGYLYSGAASEAYSKDVIARAKTYEKELDHIGSYTYYKGMNVIRENVAKFIQNRDNVETHKEDILLSNGASGGIKIVLQALLEDPKDTILAPIPQYPLYSACIQLLGSTLAGYYLDESKNWEVDIKNLDQVYHKYHDSGHRLKALVVINPGNPTGNILSEKNIEDIIKFCYNHKVVILADEVYQNNIYSETKKFHSFKKVLGKMGEPYNQTILFSFNSVSKGYYGE
jgi:alanine transaminase